MINELLDLYLPLKKMTKRELKQQQKPWITTGIFNSMKRRDRLLKKFTKAKHELIKIQYHKEHKKLRNQIVALSRINKKNYYQNFFTENANNLKKTWQGIKSIININSNNKSQPSSLQTEEGITTDPTVIANEFNNYFSNVASNLQDKIHNSGHHFSKHLKNRTTQSFFMKPTDKYEILELIN